MIDARLIATRHDFESIKPIGLRFMNAITRRNWLQLAIAANAINHLGNDSVNAAVEPIKPRPVAGIVTVYRHNSHADVILTKILEGWRHDGGPGPALKLASLYVDQFPENDIARKLAKKHGVPIFDSIEKAVTVGTKGIPVDGVISIGEHGEYPSNSLGQHLYPRRQFFEGITNTFEKYGKVVPVFSDKHLGPTWEDAKWMYDQAVKLKVPFMAGSSLQVGFRSPEIVVPMGSDIEAAVGIGYSGLDVYASHALACYQTLVQRRRNAEKGVKSVQFLQGSAMWNLVDSGRIAKEVLQSAFDVVPKTGRGQMRQDEQAALILFEYQDGFLGAQFMFQCVQRTSVAVKLRGEGKPFATSFEERPEPRHPHFAYLVKAIERMIHTGRPTYPVEQTLLTGGILDRALHSRAKQSTKLNTPELAIAYQPVDYPHAPRPDLLAPPAG
jgi:hypothetical protein